MSTLLDVISGALTAIGQLGQGQSPNAEDAALGLRRANLLLSQWGTQRLYLYYVNTRQYTLTGVADYTLGPSGTLSTDDRPTFIESAQMQASNGGPWVTLSILDKKQWDAIRTKDATASVADDFWPEYSYPAMGLHFNPAPSSGAKVKLGCWEQLAQFASVADSIAFPPAYEEFLESTLAITMAPDYDQPVPATLALRQQRAEAAVMKINAQSLGGSLGEGQTLQSPNLGAPIMPAAAGGSQ